MGWEILLGPQPTVWEGEWTDMSFKDMMMHEAFGFEKSGPVPTPRAEGVIKQIMKEKDPNGVKSGEPGAKLDAGKIQAHILQDFALALTEVMKVATFGSNKYSRGGWMYVPEGFVRYSDAMMRHYLKERTEGPIDPDSGLHHAAHLAWNALARLQFLLEGKE